MKKNKGEFKESSEIFMKKLYHSLCYNNSGSCIHNGAIYLEDNKKLRKCNHICIPKKLSSGVFKSTQFSTYKKTIIQFIKLLEIYQFFMLHFVVAMAQTEQKDEGQDLLSQIQKLATAAWEAYKKHFQNICIQISIPENHCEKPEVAIPVIVLLFLFVFGIFSLICCKCCCRKSCCKKKGSEDSNVDYNQFFMGPDEQMYSQMYQAQMMQPQMIPTGMMYPQMYTQIYPQMYQAGIQ
ncbi:hypothetical protein PVP01_0902500 [Plasmodium vivax]|uniref:Uncharacterized protein n=1 Tax=Plasmodium vivax TaxID=5855 RepID=A0A564ZWF0_PLAVI|nr:hypothetical protein PVP01_0902500 [Plasmodium vivax]